MQPWFADTTVEGSLHVVDDGNLMTSAGIPAGKDLALSIVTRCFAEEIATAWGKYTE
jgi:transcriptional regulator GlxA family with amidase domain